MEFRDELAEACPRLAEASTTAIDHSIGQLNLPMQDVKAHATIGCTSATIAFGNTHTNKRRLWEWGYGREFGHMWGADASLMCALNSNLPRATSGSGVPPTGREPELERDRERERESMSMKAAIKRGGQKVRGSEQTREGYIERGGEDRRQGVRIGDNISCHCVQVKMIMDGEADSAMPVGIASKMDERSNSEGCHVRRELDLKDKLEERQNLLYNALLL